VIILTLFPRRSVLAFRAIPVIPGFLGCLIQANSVKGTKGVPFSLSMNWISFLFHYPHTPDTILQPGSNSSFSSQKARFRLSWGIMTEFSYFKINPVMASVNGIKVA